MELLTRLREGWSNLETRSQVTLVAALLGVLVTFYVIYSFAGKTSYTTLASGLDPAQTGQAEKTLATAGISYRISQGGTQIDVPSSKLSDARVALSSKGVLSGSDSFSAFDKSSLGTTDFQQQVQYQQALQSEIAQTIEQVQGVAGATVTLVLPQDTLFADEQSRASAAVLLSGGASLDAATISGIAHLVSSSVKGLDAKNVTITSDTGQLLWPTGDAAAGGATATSKLQADSMYASELAAQINGMLNSTLGPGKALAQVHADLNVDKTTLDKVTYAKKGVPLTEQKGNETLQSKGGGAALPAGATTNTSTTGSYAATTGANGQSQYRNTTATTTYGIDKTIERSVLAPGSVNRVDVALMVDQSVPAAQVAALKSSVSSLVGLTPSRGDTLAVSRIAFAKTGTTARKKSSPLSSVANPVALGKDVVAALAALIFLFFVRRSLKRREGESSVAEPTWLRELEHGVTLAELEAGQPLPALPSPDDLERRKETLSQVEEIANNRPEALAAQIAAWMKE